MRPPLFLREKILSLKACLIVFIFFSCDKETQIDYPLVFTGEIMHVTLTGAEFHGKIIDQGSGIIDHGFLWDQNARDLTIGNAYQVSLGPVASESFSSQVEGAFSEGETYHVRAYVSDSRTIVYGRTASFTSLGGAAPQIFDFEPTQGAWTDTLTISGRNFSRQKDQNMIKVGNHIAQCIFASDTLLKAVIPASLTTITSKISVTVFGNTSTADEDFVILPPEIHEYSPEEGLLHTIVTLSGKNFHPLAKVYFDQTQAQITSISSTYIKVKVPPFHEICDVKITINVFGQTNEGEHYFKFLHPEITGFSADTGTWGDQLVIYGKYLPRHQNTYVKFNNYYAEVLHRSNDSITVKVPHYLSSYSNHISIVDDSNNQRATSAMKFELIKPTITGFTPKHGTFDNAIEITGAYFHPEKNENRVTIGKWGADIISHSSNSLIVQVPRALIGLTHNISLNIHDYIIDSDDFFHLTPPTVDRLENDWFARGHPLKIHGSGFNPNSYSNLVMFGNQRLGVEFANTNLISASRGFNWQDIPLENTGNISVEIAGQVLNPNEVVTFYEPWSYTNISGHYIKSVKEVSFSIGGRHFFAEHQWLFEYIPNTNTLTRRSDVPFTTGGLYDYANNSTFTVASKAYVLHKSGFHRYDPAIDTWSVMNAFPGKMDKGTLAFMAGNTGYMIANPVSGSGREVWRYDEAEDTWTRVADFPFVDILRGVSFTLNGKGYVGMGMGPFANSIWEYDPGANLWHEKIDLSGIIGTGTHHESSVFILDNLVYIAGGYSSHSYINNVYRYDPAKNTFTKLVDLPYAAGGAFGFTHEGRGYVIGGYGGGYSQVQIFDPSKLPPALMHAN